MAVSYKPDVDIECQQFTGWGLDSREVGWLGRWWCIYLTSEWDVIVGGFLFFPVGDCGILVNSNCGY